MISNINRRRKTIHTHYKHITTTLQTRYIRIANTV